MEITDWILLFLPNIFVLKTSQNDYRFPLKSKFLVDLNHN